MPTIKWILNAFKYYKCLWLRITDKDSINYKVTLAGLRKFHIDITLIQTPHWETMESILNNTLPLKEYNQSGD